MLKVKKLSLLILLCLLMLGSPERGLADVAPPEPPHGTNPLPGEDITNVRMVSETVVMKIDADSPTDEGLANVTATFIMRNLGEKDEVMEVRFPLYYKWDTSCNFDFWYFGPSIADFAASVDGLPVQSSFSDKTFSIEDAYGVTQNFTVACWATFPVTFPKNQDVTIQVTYTAEPYHHYGYYGYSIYSYILETGAGWRDTIGTADIIVQMPYELNQFNVLMCSPAECEVSDTQVRWHFEDLEPDFSGVEVYLLPHREWYAILREQTNTANNPNDGEAWGRLGKAYKYAIMSYRGSRYDQAGLEMYQLSVEAYEKALELLPQDAEWHFGYAELICSHATWDSMHDINLEAIQECVEQLKIALDINPQYRRAQVTLKEAASFFDQFHRLSIVDLSESHPDYLILTPNSNVVNAVIATSTANHITPTRVTRTPSMTPTLRNTIAYKTLQPGESHGWVTATSPATATPLISQVVSSPTPVPLIVVPPTPSQPAESRSPSSLLWVPIGIVVVAILGFGLMRMVKR